MKSKKLNYNFPITQIIEGNLSTQSIQKSLKDNFGILKPSLTTFKNPNFIKNYQSCKKYKAYDYIYILWLVIIKNKL